MMEIRDTPYYVISLRGPLPSASAAALRGEGVVGEPYFVLDLTPWDIVPEENWAWPEFDLGVITSPAAASLVVGRFESLLHGYKWFAPGQGTAAVLRALVSVEAPMVSQDSEGLLALPALQSEAVQGRRVAVFTAPGGRGLIPRVLRERGAEVAEVFVYRRVEVAPDPAVRERWASLRAHSGARGWVWVTSAAAYRALRAQLSEPERLALSGLGHVVSSERIDAVVGSLGAAEIVVAAGPSESDLWDALANAGMNGGCVGR